MNELQREVAVRQLRRAAKLIEDSIKSNDANQIDGMCNAICSANARIVALCFAADVLESGEELQ